MRYVVADINCGFVFVHVQRRLSFNMFYTNLLLATLRNSGPGPPTDSPNKLSVPGSSRTFPRESDSKKGKRIGHRRVTQEGTVTYKKKPTTEIQRALQLGIQHHIGSIQQQRMRDVLYRDFQTIETVQFPAAGSKTTPAHTLSDFRFRTYAPIAFRNFRSKYKLDIRDFLKAAAQTSGLAAVAASGGDEFEASAINANHNGFHPEVASSQRDIVEPIRSSFTSNSSMTTATSYRSHQYRVPPGADGERIVPIGSLTDSVSQAQASSPSSNFQRGTSRARSGKRLAAYCTAMESIEASSKPVELEKEELGLIPSGGIPARSSTGDRLLLYMGIIDILQSYRLAKKLEHGLFALAIDGETVSVAPPNFYSQRFQEFLSRKVFKRIQSLDQPTLLGPNAMRFRRFVELVTIIILPPARLPACLPSSLTSLLPLLTLDYQYCSQYLSSYCFCSTRPSSVPVNVITCVIQNSLCNHELRELSNPGKSGSIFYITQDDEFIIKTIQHREGEFLRALLPSYFMNLMQHPPTLLPKYHGFYCYQTSRKNIRFVVMNNLLPSSVRIHDKYDLKGSTYRRRASDKELARDSPTLKDLDFRERHPDGIWLEAETYDALIKTIEQDCLVLESLQIMDYSLLLGIHNLDQAKRDRVRCRTSHTPYGLSSYACVTSVA
ncbi:hypothetical protein EG68_03892 [Paragonimus skrjabini miyazakii]|uniref:PIPK domain-containing protein n=1 Tax=Paragonimus skrjabini miyazakii TaxID=59628 RepID=A0A8S9YZK2_9TREM|nr:hypothetical protein EG68_03892 [Paragonimus skrjabini miyazakii]